MNGVSNQPAIPAATPLPTGTSGAGNHSLNETDFLKLMAAELKYQDPTHPVDNTQFVAELAQFSSLAAVTQQEKTLKSILSAVNAMGGQPLVAASQLVGKTVTTAQGSGTVSAVTLDASGQVSVDVGGMGSVNLSAIVAVK